MYSTDYNNLVKALDKDLAKVEFKKIKRSVIINSIMFVSFDYAGRYTIEVELENYNTSMWYYNGDCYNLLLSSSFDEELASIGKKLIDRDFKKILSEACKKD